MLNKLPLVFLVLSAPLVQADTKWPEPLVEEASFVEVSQVNRWKGGFPEESSSGANPWANEAATVPDPGPQKESGFPAQSQKFPDPEYSPYEEGRKKIQSRNSASAGKSESLQAPAQGSQAPVNVYVMPGAGAPYGGYGYRPPYGGYGYPGPYGDYGQPWGNIHNTPWGGGLPYPGGSMPFYDSAPWGSSGMPFYDSVPWGSSGMPFYDSAPWGGGDNSIFPFSW
jgi:hypothetical protein